MDANTIGTILAVVTAMGLPTGLLFRALMESHANTVKLLTDQIQDLQDRLDRQLTVTEGQNQVTKDLVQTSRQRRS